MHPALHSSASQTDRHKELMAPDHLPSIRISGLGKSFDDFVAVDAINLEVSQGELFSLLGPNGAGKTTTIKMLCCLMRPSRGTAEVMGHDIVADPIGVKRVIDVSPQETAIAEHLSAKENLALMAGLHGLDKATTQQRSSDLLDMMGLTDRAEQRVKKYSGGMKRRLSIAMALVSEPKVLFLDEPTLGLDPQSRRSIWEHIEGLKGKTTVLLTTHYLEEADALADRIAIIDQGKIVALGTPQELKDRIGGSAMVVEAENLTDSDIATLKTRFPTTRRTASGIEIEDQDATLHEIGEVLRPRGVVVTSTYRRQVTLDDVFLELTGKQLRQ